MQRVIFLLFPNHSMLQDLNSDWASRTRNWQVRVMLLEVVLNLIPSRPMWKIWGLEHLKQQIWRVWKSADFNRWEYWWLEIIRSGMSRTVVSQICLCFSPLMWVNTAYTLSHLCHWLVGLVECSFIIDLPKLQSIVFGERSFNQAGKLILENLPSLQTIRICDDSFYDGSVLISGSTS